MLAAALLGAAGFGLGVFEGLRARPDTEHWFKIVSDALLAVTAGLGWLLARRPAGQPSFLWKKRADPNPSSPPSR